MAKTAWTLGSTSRHAGRSGAGSLNHLVHFQRRAVLDDGYGNPITGDWTTQFTEPCRLTPKMGGEGVFAGRLVGQQPYNLIVRSSDRTRAVTGVWRAVNARGGEVYDVKTNVNVDERGAYQEMLVMRVPG